ncbi:MAG: S8 family serine peptidase [Deltaproteobacteria bacterium]|nr:S8 family serine peptidase [Deltaproteobacteria bacterium]
MRNPVSKAGVALVVILGTAVSLGMMHIPKSVTEPESLPPGQSPPALIQPPVRYKKTKPPTTPTLIAIIDTGIDIHHPALKGRIWENPGETGFDSEGRRKESNGIDDDGNDYVDDVHGYDFTRSQDATNDEHGHGTHIAGIIDKISSQEKARYMSLIYFRNGIDGESALKNSIEAVRYAIRMKVDVINYSGGGNLPNAVEKAVFEEANRQGILVVAAAGNEASNSERRPFYPANYHLPNILSVTATDGRPEGILPSSNFGRRSVAVAAPGKEIRSTLPGGKFGTMTGTSQATAFVTGAAVRVLQSARAQGLDPSPEFVIEKLVATGSVSLELNGKTRKSTHLDRKEIEEMRPSLTAKSFRTQSQADFRIRFKEALRQEVSAGHGPL